MKSTTILALLFFAIPLLLKAQTVTVSSYTSGTLNGCQSSSNFQFQATKSSGNYVTSDTIHLDFGFTAGIELASLNVTSGGPGTVSFTGSTAYITGISGTSVITVQHTLQQNCLVSGSATFSTQHSLDSKLFYNGTVSTTNSTLYNVTPPSLSFTGGTNLNYNLAQFNVPITRTYTFRNGSSIPFDGYFEFDDTTFYNQGTASFRIDTLYLSYGPGVELSHTINDSTGKIMLQVSGLLQTDSLVITEIGYLFACQTSAVENSTTRFSAMFGCQSASVCKIANYVVTPFAVAHFDPNDIPVADFVKDIHVDTCLQNTMHMRHVIKNIGLGAASGSELAFNLPVPLPSTHSGGKYYLDSLDTNSLVAYVGGVLVDAIYRPVNGSGYFYLDVHTPIPAGDSVVYEYDVYFTCTDSTGYGPYFNETAYLHPFHHPLYGQLKHPCSAPSTDYGNGYYSHPQSLAQSFNNLVGQMSDGQIAVFELENASNLVLGNSLVYYDPILIPTGSTQLVPYDLSEAEIEIRVKVENGLLFNDPDSLYMYSLNGAIYTPIYASSYYINTGGGIGTGDELVARFIIPSSWYTPYTSFGEIYSLVSPEFLQFFNSFSVHFPLQAECSLAPSDGTVSIQEEFYILPTANCTTCRIPLATNATYTNINCPGCVLPGWNLTEFSFERQNVGLQDDNNNHLPDVYLTPPANNPFMAIQSAMIGDTIKGTIHAFVSDGQDVDSVGNPVGYTFASAGFVYDEGMVYITNAADGYVINDLEFIGGTGVITILDNTGTPVNHSFNVPASAAEIGLNGGGDIDRIGIPMGATDLQSYGVTAFTAYTDSVTYFSFYPEFRVVNNLVDLSAPNSHSSVRKLNCFLYMGGMPFTLSSITSMQDANDNIPFLLTQDSTVRSGYKYWCTSYEGRFVGVGLDLRQVDITGRENLYPYASICLKAINFQYWVSAGHQFVGFDLNQEAANTFPYEVRELAKLDTLTIHFPSDYEPHSVGFSNYDPKFDSLQNDHDWIIRPFYYDLNNAIIGSDYITIFPSQFIAQISYYPPYPTSYYYSSEENHYYNVGIYLKPKNCDSLPPLLPYTNNTAEISYSDFPFAEDYDTSYTETIGLQYLPSGSFRNPHPDLSLTELTNGVVNQTNYWDVSMATDAIQDPPTGYDQAITHSAENVFVTFASPSGHFSNFQLSNLITYNNVVQTPSSPNQIDTWGGNPVYGLNYLGYSYYVNELISKQFRINADFNCTGLPAGTEDSIYAIFGWNCFGYPTSLEEACFADTAVLYFTVPETALQLTVMHEDTVGACSVTDVAIDFDPVVGETDSVYITLFESQYQAYTYVPGSAYLVNNGVTTYQDPTAIGGDLVWGFSNLGAIFSSGTEFHYQLQTGCHFEIDSLLMNIRGYNYCGLEITNVDNYWGPEFVTNLPPFDSLIVSAAPTVFTSCSSSNNLDFTIINAGSGENLQQNTLTFVIPDGMLYTGSSPDVTQSGDTLIIDIGQGIDSGDSASISLPFVAVNPGSCDTITFPYYLTNFTTYECDTDTCVAQSITPQTGYADFVINLPEITYDEINTTALCEGDSVLTITSSSDGLTSGTLEVIDLNSGTVIGSVSVNYSGSPIVSVIPLTMISDTIGLYYDGCSCSDTLIYSYVCDTTCLADASFTVENTCVGDTIMALPTQADGTHSWTYSFFGMTSSADTAYFPAATVGYYTITHIVTSTCGASDTVTQTVHVTYPIFSSIQLIGSSPFCEGDSVQVTVWNAGNFVEFDWNTGDTTSIIWVDSSGIYHVNVTDTNGCVSYCPSIALIMADSPEPFTDTVYLCSSSTITLDAGQGDTYLWSNGDTTQTISVNIPGVYTVQVCNDSVISCCVTDTIIVLEEDFYFDIQDTLLCSNDSIVLSSPVSGSAYEWSTGSMTSTTLITDAGVYWLTVTSSNGCEYTDTFTVSNVLMLSPGFTYQDTVCTSDTLTCFYPDYDEDFVQHSWEFVINGMSYYSYDAAPCFQFSTEGLVTVTHHLITPCGTLDTSVQITVISVAEDGCITIIGQNPFCEGDSVLLTTTTPYVNVEWMNGSGSVIGMGDTLTVYEGGIYSANATDSNGCVSTCICTSLQMIDLNTVDFPDTVLCSEEEVVTFTLPEGTGYWSNGTVGDSATFTTTGDYSVNVITPEGCTYTDDFTVNYLGLEVAASITTHGLCTYSFTATSLPNCTYTWYFTNTGVVFGNQSSFGPVAFFPGSLPPTTIVGVTLVVQDTVTGCSTMLLLSFEKKGCTGSPGITPLLIYPNPATTEIVVEHYFDQAKKARLKVLSMTGDVIMENNFSDGQTKMQLDVSKLATGVYVIELDIDDEIIVYDKFVKEK